MGIVATSAYTDEFFVELNKTRTIIFAVSLLSILLGGLIIYIFSNKITGPLNKMSEVGNKIANGELDTELPIITTNDEIQDISDTMNLLVGALKYLKNETKGK
ncbi:MAG: HAMP domain-containing protein [ANME-2 cluster archaeon]|nr:HAMP domain-containing protein [ANME-2 cluster archaeon]